MLRQNGAVNTTPKAPRLPPFGIRRNLLRPDGGERSVRVTHIELLFDLIFVFALTQLSRYLYENQSPTGALESAVLVLALWWVWVYTTWVTNWLDPARLPVRAAVIGLALVGLIMSVSIFESFGDRGLTFAIAYVVLQIGRTVFMIAAVARHNRDLSHDFARVLIWLAASGVFWILGGLASIEFRIWFWLIALGIEYLSGAVGFRLPGQGSARVEDWDISGPHIAQRSALFVIIALGESFLVTGFAFVAQESSAIGVASVLLAFVNAVTLWWLYFDHAERAGAKAIARADKPGRIGNRAYTYTHAIIIAGIVLGSVADKEVLGHPDDAMKISTAIVIAGGPLLYLVGLTVFRWIVVREMLLSHIVGAALMVVTFAASAGMTPFVLFAVMTAILVATAAWETTTRVRAGGDDEQAG
jgi:low temperature requirement protein LtrA